MPLRWKLVGIYAGLLAAVVAGFSVAMVMALRSSLEHGAAAEVAARTRGLGAVVEFEDNAWGFEPGSGVEQQFAGDSGLYYRIVDDRGAELLSSPLANLLQLSPTAVGERTWQRDGRRFLERTSAVAKSSEEGEPAHATTLRVTCGRDLRDIDLAVASLTRLLLWLGPLVLLLSLGGGLLLAGRALAPIDQIARTAAAISEKDLGQRIAVHGRDELAALAATLNATFDRLQQAFEREQRLTADASHELRTPLAVIAGNLELALGRARSPEEMQDLLREVAAAARQMQGLIEGLLLLARTDHGAMARDAVALSSLCQETVRSETAAAKAQGVDLRCDGVEALTVCGDASCLQQLLRNLIRNGVRYNREGGHVVVRLREVDGRARLEVEDDGIGIPAQALPRLGERFFRVDPSRTRSTGGVGLGLSIVKAIVRSHGGEVRFESVEGKGTRVLVTLPRA